MAPKKQSAQSRKRDLAPDHKAAMALGREQGRIVSNYLAALEQQQGGTRRGRKVDMDKAAVELAELDQSIPDMPASTTKLKAIFRQTELRKILAPTNGTNAAADLASAQAEFVKIGADYARRMGYSREVFRAVGVPAAVLREAGIK